VRFRLVGEQVVLERVEGEAEQRGDEALQRLRLQRPRPALSTDAILALCRGEA
jgi:hypothetical protein